MNPYISAPKNLLYFSLFFPPKNVNIKTLNHNGNIIIIVCKIQYLFLINAYAHPSAGTVFQFLLYQVHTYTVR